MSVQTFVQFNAFLAWFTERANARAMRVREIPLHEIHSKGWEIVSDDGGVTSVSSQLGFGRIAGREIVATDSGREIASWKQAVWGNDEGGPVLIVTAGEGEDRLVLLRALAQPGHAGLWIGGSDGVEARNSRVCVAPSANFSFANFVNNAHKVPFGHQIAEFETFQPDDPKTSAPQVDKQGRPVYKSRNVRLRDGLEFELASADGARVDGNFERDEGKMNGYLQWATTVDEANAVVRALPEAIDYAWVPMSVVRDIRRYRQPENRGGLMSEHCRAGLAILL